MKLNLTRESVAAGDDVDAPHALTLEVAAGSTLRALLALVMREDYLASIQGGKATWSVLEGKKPLAVLAQEWAEPKFIVSPDTQYAGRTLHLYFDYHAQRNPDEVFAELSRASHRWGR